MKKLIMACVWFALAAPAFADDDEGMQMGAAMDETTKQECSACHIAYPAGFLPARSWQAIMGNLQNHFGEDASLEANTASSIQDYLVANAADQNANARLLRGVKPDQTPLRISELPWFKRQHSEEVSPARLKKAGGWSNCVACHQGAANGFFEDD